MTYFNEIDLFASQWLRNLYPAATVDERSIKDVTPDDVVRFERCHFFAGIAGWEYALELAGWGGGLAGPGRARANRSRSLGKAKASKTKGISGQSSSASSASADQESSSESKSRVPMLSDLALKLLSSPRFRMATTPRPTKSQSELLIETKMLDLLKNYLSGGSMEYRQTWKAKVTPFGRRLLEHTASVRRTSDKDCTGWPSPETIPSLVGWPTARAEDAESSGTRHSRGVSDTLTAVAKLTLPVGHDANAAKTSFATSTECTPTIAIAHQLMNGHRLELTHTLAGWVSPASRDYKDTPGMSETGTNPDGSTRTRVDQLPRQVHGLTSPSSHAATVGFGAFRLNPAMSRWLMAFPQSPATRCWDGLSPGWEEWDEVQKLLAELSQPPAATESDD